MKERDVSTVNQHIKTGEFIIRPGLFTGIGMAAGLAVGGYKPDSGRSPKGYRRRVVLGMLVGFIGGLIVDSRVANSNQ
jgi:hypothetical protein